MSLGLFRKGKTRFIATLHSSDDLLFIILLGRGKNPSYSGINTICISYFYFAHVTEYLFVLLLVMIFINSVDVKKQ